MGPRNSDSAMGGLIRQSLSGEASTRDRCPAPDMLAAYCDRSLTAEEVSRCELHFSQCPRCREQLALITASEQKLHPASTRTWLWDWRWLAATAAMLILAISWGVKRSERSVTGTRSPEPLLALSEPNQAPAPEDLPVAPSVPEASASSGVASAPSKSQNQKIPGELQEKSSRESAPKKQHVPSAEAPPQQQETPTALAQSAAAANLPLNGRSDLHLQSGNIASNSPPAAAQNGDAQAKSAARAPAAFAGSDSQITPVPPKASETAGSADRSEANRETSLVQPGPAASGAPPKSPVVGGVIAGAVQSAPQNAEQRSDQILISTPDPKVIWRITGAGFVERTTDGGATWNGQQPDPDVQLTAGSAPSAKVCWLIGKNGAILLTKDAAKWKKIPPPVPADFTEVTAKSASAATVTTADGQKFSTIDGGKKWKPEQ